MRKNNYSMLLAGVLIIVLLLTFVLLVKKQKKLKYDLESSTNITNTVVFPKSNPPLDEVSSGFLGESEKIDTGILVKTEKIDTSIIQKEEIIEDNNSTGESIVKAPYEKLDKENENYKNIDLNSNQEQCNKISNLELKNGCLDNYYNNIASESLDYNLCTKINNLDLKNNCNYVVVLNKIESPDFNQGVEICDILDGTYKTYCQSKFSKEQNSSIMQNAVNNMDIKLCNSIKDIALELRCKDIINFKLAINSKDVNNCNLINDETLNSQCRETLTITN